MAAVRKHWRLAVLNLLVLAIAVGWLAHRMLSPVAVVAADAPASAVATPEAEPLDPALYSRVAQFRDRLRLRNADLARAGCGRAEAEGVLRSLAGWCAANRTAVEQADQAELLARRAVRECLRKIHVGPRDPSDLSRLKSLKSALTTASDARVRLEASAGATATAGLSGDTAAVLRSLRPAAAAGSGVVPSALAGVSVGGGTSLPAVGDAAMAAVAAAEQAVLPVPPALREPAMAVPGANAR